MSSSVFDMLCSVFFIFFFFKQKTAYEMRISDWSSDVCSSDLRDRLDQLGAIEREGGEIARRRRGVDTGNKPLRCRLLIAGGAVDLAGAEQARQDRKRVV